MTNSLAAEGTWPRERLDRDYNARATVTPELFEAEIFHYRTLSDTMRGSYASHLDVVYDHLSDQTLDFFGASNDLRPVFLFIHGGYWRVMSKRESAFMAGTLAKHGVVTAVVDYQLAPTVSLTEIVREVRSAVAFLWHHGRKFGVDPNRIFVGGSSAGGHLTGTIISGGWQHDFGVPDDVVKGALPISGLFHLAPIANSFVQDWISLDKESIRALSPAENLPSRGCLITVAYADHEADGFTRQSIQFHRLWREAGFASQLLEVPDRHHFSVVLDLCVDESLLTHALLRLIRGDVSQ